MSRRILEIFLLLFLSLQQDFHVLVIDDGSPDGTAQIVKDLQSKYNGQLF
jgi:dolichol-phosphate mannosyltransferase